jgi:hypothetical protein
MTDTKEPGFLSLPFEIREMIYKLLLVSDQWIIVERKPVSPKSALGPYQLWCYRLPKIWNSNPESGWSAQFLRVCKYFHGEASRFLYGNNKFELSLETLEQKFLPTIGTHNASFIRYMEIARTELCRPKATCTIPNFLQALSNLRCMYFAPIIKSYCTSQCGYFCKHTSSQRKILVLRLAHQVTSDHSHLKWLLEFKDATYTTRNNVWYKLSDDECNKHPPRPHQHPERHRRSSHWRPQLKYEVAGDVIDMEEQLSRIKVVKVPTGRHVHRSPVPIAERPAWRV